MSVDLTKAPRQLPGHRPRRAVRRRRFTLAPHFWRRLVRGRWLVITLVVLLAAGIMVRLGIWQLGRWQGRREANAAITKQLALPPLQLNGQAAQTLDPATLTFRRVQLSGTWDYAHEVELRYRSFDNQAGVHLLTPLRLDDSAVVVIVDRGWIPYQQAGAENRRSYQQVNHTTFEGLIYPSVQQDDPSPEPGVVSQIDLNVIGAEMPYPVQAYWVQRLPVAAKESPPRAEGLPDLTNGSHLAYTMQWWGFATTLLITYFLFANQTMLRSSRPRPEFARTGPR